MMLIQELKKRRAKALVKRALELDPTLRQLIHLGHDHRHWVIFLDELFTENDVREREKLRHETLRPLTDGLKP